MYITARLECVHPAGVITRAKTMHGGSGAVHSRARRPFQPDKRRPLATGNIIGRSAVKYESRETVGNGLLPTDFGDRHRDLFIEQRALVDKHQAPHSSTLDIFAASRCSRSTKVQPNQVSMSPTWRTDIRGVACAFRATPAARQTAHISEGALRSKCASFCSCACHGPWRRGSLCVTISWCRYLAQSAQ